MRFVSPGLALARALGTSKTLEEARRQARYDELVETIVAVGGNEHDMPMTKEGEWEFARQLEREKQNGASPFPPVPVGTVSYYDHLIDIYRPIGIDLERLQRDLAVAWMRRYRPYGLIHRFLYVARLAWQVWR